MQKKILVSGPLLSASGYGKMCRFALEALAEHPEKYDIYVNPTTWGQTGWLFEENDQYNWINALRAKTQQHIQAKGQFDIALQITIPNEWKRLAPVNIGYTAGIETHVISPAWLEPSNQMDKIITISEFSKTGFVNTIFGNDKGQQFRVTTPVEVVHFPVEEVETAESTIELPSAYNFLTVNQWGPRKNMETLVKAFVDEFRDEDVGLVIKANTANDSIMDKIATESRLTALLASLGAHKCRVHLVHGRMSDAQMAGLYRHNKIKAFVTATHGEGFGFPIFEAVNTGLPVVATDWSGHLDFLSMPDEQGKDKKMFAKVDFELKQIDPSHVWPGVMEAQAAWAYPTVGSLRSRMREVYKDSGRFNSWAKKLSAHNKEKFDKVLVYKAFIDCISINSNEIVVL
jgi:glycosyltransferase involved in cell wall biosynthesis